MASRGGSIKSTSINGVKLYSLSSQRSLASWVPPKKRRALRKDQDHLQRVDLIQDLKFETASTRIKVTPDGEYVIASGIYPPQVKVFELRELSLKFERHLISEIVNFQVLDEDYSKIAFLCADRSVCLHAKYGSHYSLRIPRMGRDIAYDCWSCDLLCAASSPDVYRINLEQGRFLSSLNSQSPAINVISRSGVHGLVACGGEDGAVECFDTRKKSSIGRIDAARHASDADHEITALQFDAQGYLMAVGSSAGKISIYDLRMSDPIRIKDHMYGSPIVNIQWHQTLNSEEPKLVTADRSIVRIWDPNTGDNMTTIEPNSGVINDVCIFHRSGLMFLALDNVQIPAYFIPALGPAPKWCSYLENLTEEMEEGSQTTIYDDFKFLTEKDIERLNLSSYIGSNLLRAYMHGYFVDYRLYKKALANVNPFAYEDYIAKQREARMEATRGSRITEVKKLPKVNRALYAKLSTEPSADEQTTNIDDNTKKKLKKTKGLHKNILDDERFKAIFSNEDFEVDELSPEFLALHPQTSSKQTSLVDEHFEPVMEDEYGINDSDSPASSEDELYREKNKKKSSKPMRLYEVKDERHAEAFLDHVSLAKEDALPLGERVSALEKQQTSSNNVKFGPGGSREISFVSRSKKGKDDFKKRKDEVEEPLDRRRSIKPLGLKPGKAEFYAMGGKGSRGKWQHPKGKGKRK